MKELVDKLKNNPDFTEFEKWLVNEIEKLDTVNGLENLSDELAGQEAKVRILAKNKLISILAPFITLSEKKPVSAEQLKEAKGKYLIS